MRSSWRTLGDDPAVEMDKDDKCCFLCKDGGGDLRDCDFRNCPKTYHPCCVEDKYDIVPSPNCHFVCGWHICFNCKGSSHFQCMCCPMSVCHDCLGKVEFVELRMQLKGFCIDCLNKAILIEKSADSHPHRISAQSDYNNAEIYDILFKDHWKDVKDREHVTLVYLEEARVILTRKLLCNRVNSEKLHDEDHKSDANIFYENAAIEKAIPFDCKGKQNKVNTSLKKNGKSNKKTYIGWGSEELMQFLSSFGMDTSKSLDEVEISEFIMGYIKENNLFNNNNKKSFLCDDKLHHLFGRRKVRCKSIRRFLEVHLAANAISEDENFDASEDDDVTITKKKPHSDGSEDDDAPIMKKEPRNRQESKIAKRVSERNKRCFACLNENNLKLIYLRRTLVINLLNHPQTFDQKVIGCFVRIKNGPKVHIYEMPKKLYQLGQVTGIKKSSEEYKINGTCTNILLCVTGLWEDVKISILSDEDFEEEECNDLVSLVKKGVLKRPTIAALEEKVATVHKDIVNHWIEKELVRLERAIDRAYMKGWRPEFEELMQQKELLSTEAEKIRRLEEVPEIVADTEQEGNETELKVVASNYSQENRGNTNTLIPPPISHGVEQQGASSLNDLHVELPKGAVEEKVASLGVQEKTTKAGEACDGGVSPDSVLHSQMRNTQDGDLTEVMDIDKDESEHSRRKNDGANTEEAINLDSHEDEDLQILEHWPKGNISDAPNGSALCQQQHEAAVCAAMDNAASPNTPLWNYVDPQGNTQGPFPLTRLLGWAGFFDKDFKVWRTGESVEQAILLTDAFLMYL